MAMLAKARLVIADEPTTALDAQVERQVIAELLALKDRIGCSILLISHSLGLVSRICDEVYVLLGGRVIEHGPTEAVLREPREAYTRSLLACEVDLRTPRAEQSSKYRFPSLGRLPASGMP
jgi:ABC-type dipeptide/oligopeptide/nickel transport system ATPase component